MDDGEEMVKEDEGEWELKVRQRMCLLDALTLSYQESQILSLKINFLNSDIEKNTQVKSLCFDRLALISTLS